MTELPRFISGRFYFPDCSFSETDIRAIEHAAKLYNYYNHFVDAAEMLALVKRVAEFEESSGNFI